MEHLSLKLVLGLRKSVREQVGYKREVIIG